MKKLYILLLVILFPVASAFTQNTFMRSFISMYNGSAIVQTGDGGYIMGGVKKFDHSYAHPALLKLNSSGDSVWMSEFTDTVFYDLQFLKQASNGDILFCYRYYWHSSHPTTVVRTDASGNLLWKKIYYNIYATDMDICADDSFILSGEHFPYDVVLKAGGDGNEVWRKPFVTPGYSPRISASSDGYFLGGYSETNIIILTKLNLSGDSLWQRIYPAPRYDDYIHDISPAPGNGCVLAARSYINPVQTDSITILRVDQNGNELWRKYLAAQMFELNCINPCPDGSFIACGASGTMNNFSTYMVKINDSGVIDWERNFSSPAFGSGRCVINTSDGGFAITGNYFESQPGLDTSAFVITTDASGISAVKEKHEILSGMEITPNPSRGTAILCWHQIFASDVVIEINDINGKSVFKEKINGSPGVNHFTCNLHFLDEGCYLISLSGHGFKISGKIIRIN